MTMRERIADGKLFTDNCEGLQEERATCKWRLEILNATRTNIKNRQSAINELFGKKVRAWIEPPFYCCYGTHITMGDKTYVNFNCNFVDDGPIAIGRKVLIGPGVTIATVGHPICPDMREYMYTDGVTIEDNCWIGAAVTICPGVTIGKNSVIGAGSVVTKDIPANSVAAGNPCKVIRAIGEQDKQFYYKDRKIDPEDLKEEKELRVNSYVK